MVKKKNSKQILAGMSRAEIVNFVKDNHMQTFRANQLAQWVHQHYVINPADMSNLPMHFRDIITDKLLAPSTKISQKNSSTDGTIKFLIELYDQENIEMVIIPTDERKTFCLSTQVGCPIGCYFCASGMNGFTRNLEAGEIIEQIIIGCQEIGNNLPDNIVFMGIGEGLLNFAELEKVIKLLTSANGFGMSPRRLTVSTSGIVPGIDKLADLGKELNLAISLHATTDDVRAMLIPEKNRYPIHEVLAATNRYREKIGRMPTLEYILLDGINDTMDDARRLASMSKKYHTKINLIPYNDTGTHFRRPSDRTIGAFHDTIKSTGAHVTIRRERGEDKNAACGQLRRHSKS